MTRDLNVGNALSRIFSIYGDQAKVLLPVAFALFLAQGVVSAVLVEAAAALAIVAFVLQVLVSTLYQGMVVELVSDVQDGRRDHSVGSLFRAVTGVLLPLIVVGFIVGVLAVIGLFLLIVPGLIVLTIFAVAAPSVVVEKAGIGQALSRSRELVKGNGVQVFLVIFVVFLITIVLSILIGGIGAAGGVVGRILASVLASTVTAPISALAAGVLYFELRRAKGEAGPAPQAPGPDAVETGPATTSPFPGERSEAETAFGEPRPEQPGGGFNPRD